MFKNGPDFPIRLAAFNHLQQLVNAEGPVLSWEQLSQPFFHDGQPILLANRARGIFKPKAMRGGALSIKTTVPRASREARYDDQIASDTGHFVYKFQGTDPSARDNQLLRVNYELGVPMVYLYGVAPGQYQPLWPCFVVSWSAQSLQCHVSVDDLNAVDSHGLGVAADDYAAPSSALRREYVTVQAKRRVHQQKFRNLVLPAYETRCAVCGLPHDKLLDAAHIIEDRDERGRPEVQNGMALCQLHHRAYDRQIIGIRGDGLIVVSKTAREIVDGPVFEHGIRAIHGRTVRLPKRAAHRPRQDFLDERFQKFLEHA